MTKKEPFPPRVFLRRDDLKDLNWDGAEGDVHTINSPNAKFITHTETYVHESLLEDAISTETARCLVICEEQKMEVRARAQAEERLITLERLRGRFDYSLNGSLAMKEEIRMAMEELDRFTK